MKKPVVDEQAAVVRLDDRIGDMPDDPPDAIAALSRWWQPQGARWQAVVGESDDSCVDGELR